MFGRRWLEMTWRDGLFAHWAVDPVVVAETLPERLSVATYDGDAYLGVVAFVMDDVRPRGLPRGLSFPELNLRTYVEGPDGPGVYFYNLDADDPIGVAVARRLFALPYYRAEMRVRRTERPEGATDAGGPRIDFLSHRTHRGVPPAGFDATYEPRGPARTAEPGSLEAFLVENYRFYADGDRLYKGEIDHEPWRLRDVSATIRRNGLFESNGFARPEEGGSRVSADGGRTAEPHLLYADPIDVTADRLRRV